MKGRVWNSLFKVRNFLGIPVKCYNRGLGQVYTHPKIHLDFNLKHHDSIQVDGQQIDSVYLLHPDDFDGITYDELAHVVPNHCHVEFGWYLAGILVKHLIAEYDTEENMEVNITEMFKNDLSSFGNTYLQCEIWKDFTQDFFDIIGYSSEDSSVICALRLKPGIIGHINNLRSIWRENA